MTNFQEKYFEAVNSLMSAQEENYKLQYELNCIKEGDNTLMKLDNVQESLIEALDINAKLESKIAELKKSKISSDINFKREIQNLKSKIFEFQETFAKINNLNQELLIEGKCILCSRSCSCHIPQGNQKLKFKKSISTAANDSGSPKLKLSTTMADPPNQKIKVSPKPKNPAYYITNITNIPNNTNSNNTDSPKENLEKIKPKLDKLSCLKNVELFSWRSVVKENRPKGTLAFLPKKTVIIIEEGIINDFLVERVERDLILDCKVDEGSKSVPAIPKPLIDEFDEWLDYILDAQYQDKKDESLISWMDLVAREFGQEMVNDILSDMEYHHRVLKAIRLYLKKFASGAKMSFEVCWIRKSGDTENVPAIPISLSKSFLEWFKSQLQFAFYSHGNDSRKRKAESVFVESSDDD